MSTVTIKDVAARAGVSPKTVSRVINGEDHVRPEIREAVQRVVAELNYRPNAFARSLSSSRSYLLGLFIDDPVSGYAADVQHGALLRCRERSYHLVVEPVELNRPDWKDHVRASIASLRLDGAIIAPPICDAAELIDLFRESDVPHVLIAPSGESPDSGAVRMDDRGAAREMTAYLIGLGHRHIGLVQGPLSHSASARREEGFRAAMAEAGIAVDEDAVLRGDFSFRSGLERGEALLDRTDRPSAVFACNDDMALGVLITAMKLGIAVPQSLSVAGFDDSASSRAAWPQITTIRQPKAEMAAAAVDILVDPSFRKKSAGPQSRLMLPHALVVRGSTGAA
ncbi:MULTISPECIES: LacI family DNA-binding transcriptional regulator [Sphingobium]|jgi:LacI family transcriptional regulator|uniref:LacI family DNA-binding transcriptional regulator n=2 Tax=Sphingobium fuliginis (strain ATCC 27551) TaxID=336203 RepID=A0A292ZL26_SPHSA|nr:MULTISPECIES: LacI family DNA-binding transcriptional regulator [Sphingobium]OAP33027.1 transcriptional regulator [Sphingobium sp. 20006FA]AJR23981.1 transcriptional regulator [Sphingobium sp. YBL2]KXU32134.1 transcriptional regulator [Sphingobium sp. AM]KYC32026.1 transcriptional regulator [Sphingobium sp. 22B]PNQ02437.1 transcriptional regulator [Sphingobium sp. SA916]